MLVQANTSIALFHWSLGSPAVLLAVLMENAEEVVLLIVSQRFPSHAFCLTRREVSVGIGATARPARCREGVMLYGRTVLRQIDVPATGSVVGVPQDTIHYDRLQREQTAIPAIGVPLLGVRYEPVAG